MSFCACVHEATSPDDYQLIIDYRILPYSRDKTLFKISTVELQKFISVELATQGASWLNPVATVVHMAASAGRAMTDPQDELRDKVQQREEERKKETTPEQSQTGPPRTETT